MLTAKQDNRLATAETLHKELLADPTPYATDKALQRVVKRLGTIIADMLPLRGQVQRSAATHTPTGQPTDKQTARELVAVSTAEIAGDVFAYATDTKNPTLQALADYSESDLLKLRGTRLTDVATALLGAAQDPAHLPTLQADYDLTPARFQELTDALKSYDTFKTQPRQQVIAGKTSRQSLRTEFAELGTLLQDRLMRQSRKYERRAPAFYARIVAARITIDRPGSAANAGTANPAA